LAEDRQAKVTIPIRESLIHSDKFPQFLGRLVARFNPSVKVVKHIIVNDTKKGQTTGINL